MEKAGKFFTFHTEESSVGRKGSFPKGDETEGSLESSILTSL
jgi:hypothetical protein